MHTAAIHYSQPKDSFWEQQHLGSLTQQSRQASSLRKPWPLQPLTRWQNHQSQQLPDSTDGGYGYTYDHRTAYNRSKVSKDIRWLICYVCASNLWTCHEKTWGCLWWKGKYLALLHSYNPTPQRRKHKGLAYLLKNHSSARHHKNKGALKTLGMPMLLSSLLHSYVGTSSFSERSITSTKVYDATSQKIRVSSDREDGKREGRQEESYKAITAKLPIQDCFVYLT